MSRIRHLTDYAFELESQEAFATKVHKYYSRSNLLCVYADVLSYPRNLNDVVADLKPHLVCSHKNNICLASHNTTGLYLSW